MSMKKLLEQYTTEEIAEAVVLPVKFTPQQQQDANRDLAEARRKSQSEMTEDQKLYAKLLQLRFQLEDYIDSNEYKSEFTFGYFLDLYLNVIGKKRKEFAAEIQIHETLLSHLVNNRREPADHIIIRLELHSNNHIPALSWFKLLEKEKEHLISTDMVMRKREKQFVSATLPVFA